VPVSAVRYVRYTTPRASSSGRLSPWETEVRYVIARVGCAVLRGLRARDPLYLTYLTPLTARRPSLGDAIAGTVGRYLLVIGRQIAPQLPNLR
jgi:hypothetical protein